MKVPEPVRVVFDQFPLRQLEAIEAPQAVVDAASNAGDGAAAGLLGVYSLDAEGFPLDPKCLGMYCLLRLLGQHPQTEIMSPYVTAKETLPVLWTPGAGPTPAAASRQRAIVSYAEAHRAFGGSELDSKTAIFCSMLDTWVEDAWHETIMSPQNRAARTRIYADAASGAMPWPFTQVLASQLDEHLDTRHFAGQQASGDDYMCSADNLHRAGLALAALDTAVTAPSEEPTPLDVMVFAYTWPILSILSESALAALVPPGLRQHAEDVRAFFTKI